MDKHSHFNFMWFKVNQTAPFGLTPEQHAKLKELWYERGHYASRDRMWELLKLLQPTRQESIAQFGRVVFGPAHHAWPRQLRVGMANVPVQYDRIHHARAWPRQLRECCDGDSTAVRTNYHTIRR